MQLKNVKWFVVGLVSFLGSISSAASFTLTKGAGYQIEPIYGFETVYRDYPTPHINTRIMYGARLTVGSDLLSGELEYTKASDTEDFSTAPEKIKTEDEKLKLGVRSTYRFNTIVFVSGRLGGQATKETRTETSGGVETKTEEPIKYNPYAGASVGITLGPLSLSVNSTVIFRDGSDMSKNDYQNTFSVGIGY
ncbi:hypothetical protein [Bdellovibrio bacteriovorus]|uniref:hypothetical protein n=1 Tax=Bdellovibrio bacteriovorus TaxID=959 RepID=UPI0035A959F4